MTHKIAAAENAGLENQYGLTTNVKVVFTRATIIHRRKFVGKNTQNKSSPRRVFKRK